MQLIWVRHGSSSANQQKRYVGHLDVPISEEGRGQAERLALTLRDAPLSAVYSSDLRRAMDTARAICRYHPQLVICPSTELRELSFGRWEGKTYAEIATIDEQVLHRFYDDPWHCAPPGGETVAELQLRLERFLQKLHASHSVQDTVVAVSHGGVIALFQALYLRQDRNALFAHPLAHGDMISCLYDHQRKKWRDARAT